MHRFILILAFAIAGCGSGESSVSPISTARAATNVVTNLAIASVGGVSSTGVATASCEGKGTVVGGGCHCSGNASNNTDGTLFGCDSVAGANGYIGGCYSNNLNQTVTPITVTAICLATTSGAIGKSSIDESTALAEAIASFTAQQSSYSLNLAK